MSKYFLITICCMLFVQSSVQAYAADEKKDGNRFLSLCAPFVDGLDSQASTHRNHEAIAEGYCIGYFNGLQSLNRIMQFMPDNRSLFCIPKENGIPIPQLARIVVKYLRDNPSHLHNDDILLVIAALQEAFPCVTPQK